MTNKILFILVILLFFIKIGAAYYTNFDLFGDEAQYWLWSKSLDFGYYSKPPLLSWFLGVYASLFGDTFFYLKIFPMFIYLLTAWAFYDLCKSIGLDKKNVVSCSLIFLFIPAVSFSSFIISTDLFLLLFWTLSLGQLVRIEKFARLKSFVFLGVFLGLAFLSKYAAIYFIICMLFYFIIDKKFRNIFKNNYLGFTLCLVCALTVFSPNLIWNFKNGWITLHHTSDNANFENIEFSFYRGVEFLLIQIFMIGPFLFLGGVINIKNYNNSYKQNLLLAFSIPIFLIVFFEAILVRANANWAAPALISFFIFLYTAMKDKFFNYINILFNFTFCVIFFSLVGISYSAKIFDRISGIGEFSEKVFYQRLEQNIKKIAVTDRLLFSSMSYYLRNEEIDFYMPYDSKSKITNHFMISSPLKKEMFENFIFIGGVNEINYLINNYSLKKRNVPEYNFTKREMEIYEVIFD